MAELYVDYPTLAGGSGIDHGIVMMADMGIIWWSGWYATYLGAHHKGVPEASLQSMV